MAKIDPSPEVRRAICRDLTSRLSEELGRKDEWQNSYVWSGTQRVMGHLVDKEANNASCGAKFMRQLGGGPVKFTCAVTTCLIAQEQRPVREAEADAMVPEGTFLFEA